MRRLCLTLCCCLFSVTVTVPPFAQETTATITGTVTDQAAPCCPA